MNTMVVWHNKYIIVTISIWGKDIGGKEFTVAVLTTKSQVILGSKAVVFYRYRVISSFAKVSLWGSIAILPVFM
ncbi:hypothetical protein OKW21_006760 [Catalinimonas alkaloidigena]|uniref:hypothetical protein n=1 Tax=Catalinimonas alkaloidigena TaxID=1075417 RepID=UPI00240774C2|nr:hypothetical protein [Catalinimonas alkaloidigena]MDF9801267.1 hypothetical protein [Catalinimonas alkaloidigena]MDF9801451.1 hypothetical protein [Catalinimonas alkaloidigena]